MAEAAKDTRVCPYCDETIKHAAIKCRYCMEWLPDPDGPAPAAAPQPAPRRAAQRRAPVSQPYRCPACFSLSPKIQYVPDQQRIHCTACGYWTEKTFARPPSAKVLVTPRCPTCKGPSRYIPQNRTFWCNTCRARPGELPRDAPPRRPVPKKKDNALGWKVWVTMVTMLVAGLGFVGVKTNGVSKLKRGLSGCGSSDEVSVRSGVRTAPQEGNELIQMVNAGMKDLSVSKNQKQGKLIIRFSYSSTRSDGKFNWIVNRVSQKGIPLRLLVRLFKKDGQYLRHFRTREVFLPDGFETDFGGAIVRIGPSGTRMEYPVDKEVLKNVNGVEVGFTTLGL